MLLKIIISVFVWNTLGYVKTKTVDCGYEYQFRRVWPARWVYNISTLNVSDIATHDSHIKSTSQELHAASALCSVRYRPILLYPKAVTMTSHERHGVANHLTPLFVQPFIQAYIIESTKALHYWPFVRVTHCPRWTPSQRDNNAENYCDLSKLFIRDTDDKVLNRWSIYYFRKYSWHNFKSRRLIWYSETGL